jgi:sugar phosphate isomerase/epimerase
MQYIMFTKHLEGYDLSQIMDALKTAGVSGADLCTRPGYPVNPENVATALPAAAKQFADEGLSIPLVTTPGDFTQPDIDYAEALYGACSEAGVKHIKLGYWHFKPGMDYWTELDVVRELLDGFQKLSEKHGVQTVVHNHSGLSMGLNSCAAMNVVKGFDPKYVGVFADPGHLSVCGEPIQLALSIVKDYLSVLAFKDLIKVPQERNGKTSWRTNVVPLGTGFGDFPALLQTLSEMNYDGPISFHSEYSGEPPERVVELARDDVNYINGLRG